MPMRLYRFHCTDGHELVTDLRGSRLPNAAGMRVHAERVALALMERVVERFDWSALVPQAAKLFGPASASPST